MTSVARLTPLACHLLSLFAYFASSPIPDWILTADIHADEENSPGLREALNELYVYSLASSSLGAWNERLGRGVSIHRVVQDFARRTLATESTLDLARSWLRRAPRKLGGGADGLAPHRDAVARHVIGEAILRCGRGSRAHAHAILSVWRLLEHNGAVELIQDLFQYLMPSLLDPSEYVELLTHYGDLAAVARVDATTLSPVEALVQATMLLLTMGNRRAGLQSIDRLFLSRIVISYGGAGIKTLSSFIGQVASLRASLLADGCAEQSAKLEIVEWMLSEEPRDCSVAIASLMNGGHATCLAFYVHAMLLRHVVTTHGSQRTWEQVCRVIEASADCWHFFALYSADLVRVHQRRLAEPFARAAVTAIVRKIALSSAPNEVGPSTEAFDAWLSLLTRIEATRSGQLIFPDLWNALLDRAYLAGQTDAKAIWRRLRFLRSLIDVVEPNLLDVESAELELLSERAFGSQSSFRRDALLLRADVAVKRRRHDIARSLLQQALKITCDFAVAENLRKIDDVLQRCKKVGVDAHADIGPIPLPPKGYRFVSRDVIGGSILRYVDDNTGVVIITNSDRVIVQKYTVYWRRYFFLVSDENEIFLIDDEVDDYMDLYVRSTQKVRLLRSIHGVRQDSLVGRLSIDCWPEVMLRE